MMTAILHQLVDRAAQGAHSDNTTYPAYASAVVLAILSFVTMLLILPPMLWHFRSRNIGATALVAWSSILLLFNFINAILWPNDNINSWYSGNGLCDVEVKIEIASEIGRPASLACILRALAAVLDTDRATLLKTKAQRRRNLIVDLSWVVGFPLLSMLFHYIVQTRRYLLYGISGCVPAAGANLATVFLLGLPPLIWILMDSYYAILILVRLYRYRSTFHTILANNDTTKSRFMRLYVICVVWIIGYIPVECYVLYFNFNNMDPEGYSWASVHDPEKWNEILMVPSGGSIIYNRWVWVSCGLIVFVFFGFGKDAINMYRTGLLAVGFGKLFPSLRREYRGSITATVSSYSSKARMVFKRKSSATSVTWKSASQPSHTSSWDSTSPKKGFTAHKADTSEKQPNTVIESSKTERSADKSPLPRRVMEALHLKRANSAPSTADNQVPLADFRGQPTTLKSAVSTSPRSPLIDQVDDFGSDRMLMRREVRQGSEHECSLHNANL